MPFLMVELKGVLPRLRISDLCLPTLRSGVLDSLPGAIQLCNSKTFRASSSADSTNVAFTISMLLGNLSSCCNPWIYMGFNSHLRPRPLRRLPCCWGPQARPQLSSHSPSSRRTTLLTRSSGLPPLTLSPSLSGGPGPEGSPKDSAQVDAEASTETVAF